MSEVIERIQRAIELEPDPLNKERMRSVLRQALRRLDEMYRIHFEEGERSE